MLRAAAKIVTTYEVVQGLVRYLTSVLIANGMALVFIGSDDGNLHALQTATGALAWNYSTDGRCGQSTPMVATPGDGATDDAAALWSSGSSAAAAGSLVFIGCDDGVLHAVSAVNGSRAWIAEKINPWTRLTATPSLSRDGGSVFIGTLDGCVAARDDTTRTDAKQPPRCS